MPYGKFIRPFSFVVCLSFCVSLCFGLASSVVAADYTRGQFDYTNSVLQFTTSDNDGTTTLTYPAGSWPSSFYLVRTGLSADNVKVLECDFPENLVAGQSCSIVFYFPSALQEICSTVSLFVDGTSALRSSRFDYAFSTNEIVDVTAEAGSRVLNNRAFQVVDNGEMICVIVSGDIHSPITGARYHLRGISGHSLAFNINYVVGAEVYYPFIANPISDVPIEPEEPVVDSVTASVTSPAPYYPGTDVNMTAVVNGTGFEPGSPEDTLYSYVYGNTSPDTYIGGGPYSGDEFVLHIGADETADILQVEFSSTYDTTKSVTLDIPVTYPLEGVQIIPSGIQKFVQSDKQRELQFSLLLPNGDPYNNPNIQWIIEPSVGAENYYAIDSSGMLYIKADAPAGSSCNVRFAYKDDLTALSPAASSVQIITQQQGIIDSLTPTPDQSDKADRLEDQIGDAAGTLENNNSSLGELTPTRPDIGTDLELDQESLLAVSPLVTNIWSISGIGRMIGIVIMVATVAYIFFGKRDG